MSYKPKSLFRMLEDIDRHELLLPHIQRPFVWDEEQMVRLFDSLMRNYPVQTLLFWRTKEAIKARRFMQSIDREADLSDLYDSAKSYPMSRRFLYSMVSNGSRHFMQSSEPRC